MDRSTGSPMGSSDDDDDNDDDDRPNSSSSSGDDHEVASAETSNARRRRHAESSHLRSSIKVPLPSAFKASDYDDSSDGSRRNGHGHAALPPPTPPRHDNSHHHQSSSNDDSNGNKLSQDAKTHPQHAPVNLMANEQQYTSAFGHQVGKNGNVGVATAAAAAAPPSTSSQSSSSSTSSFPSSADHHHTQAMHAMSHHHQGKQVHSESKMAPAATAGDAHAGLPISSSSPADANHHQHSQTLTSPALLNPTSSQQQQQQLPYHHHDYSSSSMSRSATLDLVSPYLMAAGAMLAQNTNFQTAQVDSLNTTPTTANATHNTRKPRTWYDVLNERDTPIILALTSFPFRIFDLNAAARSILGHSCIGESLFDSFFRENTWSPTLASHSSLLGRVGAGDVVKVRGANNQNCFCKIEIVAVRETSLGIEADNTGQGERQGEQQQQNRAVSKNADGKMADDDDNNMVGYAVYLEPLELPPEMASTIVYRSFP